MDDLPTEPVTHYVDLLMDSLHCSDRIRYVLEPTLARQSQRACYNRSTYKALCSVSGTLDLPIQCKRVTSTPQPDVIAQLLRHAVFSAKYFR